MESSSHLQERILHERIGACKVAVDDSQLQRAEEDMASSLAHGKASPACSKPTARRTACALALVVLWACLGLIFALHWLFIAGVLYRRGQNRAAVRSALWHALSYWVASIAVAAGGTWCRSAGRYLACKGGEEMSWSCLMYTQPLDYQVLVMAK